MNRSRTRRTATPTADTNGDVLPRLLSAVEKHADNPSAFLALNEGNQYFREDGGDGFVVYRRSGRHLVQFGGVFAAPEQQASLLRAFRSFARGQRCTIVGIQLQRDDIDLFRAEGFTINQVGSSYSLDLSAFSLRGSKFVKLRNKISRARRSGLTVAETDWETCARDVEHIDKAWLRSKGRHVKEIEFLVGQLGGPAQKHRRLFVGTLDSGPVSYISYSPAHGSRPGWLHDLSRRLPDAPPGVMEAVNLHATETFIQEGAGWLHFGFTPFTGLDPRHEPEGASGLTGRFMRLLAEHGHAVYPASTQLAYKEKWGPQVVLPEYLAFERGASFGAIWQVLRVTKSV
ncbi:bifunctional lysylphosphatidylglycerol flippase/synthetase MprF [Streptomyces sp. NPDC058398]|uniref:bifunctional lysylphosphatidylglycerol flippase/synthetase MprF n=1 Tax=Streptomyces sp. NPDC058398 TaxID=3346479 RepID=UPI00364EB5F5